MIKAHVYVTIKQGVLDPQGKAVAGALASLGFGDVADVRVGKYLEIDVGTNDPEDAAVRVKRMCDELLANPVIEDYRFDLEPREEG
jgi:phosphoribosylformylglycinamidine synthase